MSLHILKAGLQTSVQDAGRNGLTHMGVSQSGAMDPVAMQMANWLVDRPLNSAVIEVCLIGPRVQFKAPLTIAVCGANFSLQLNGELVSINQQISVNRGDILEFGRALSGARAYLAFSGELNLAAQLGSLSTHLTARFGGFKGRALKPDDRLEMGKSYTPPLKELPAFAKPTYTGNYLLRCVNSVESSCFSDKQRQIFFANSYLVSSESNRMGVRLNGKPIKFERDFQLTSSGLTQGSIQLPPNGQAIISSVDGQTIGGYPRIANVISADQALLGQLKAQDKVSFQLIEKTAALTLLKEKQNRLKFLYN